jgi:hypothetical protein
MMMTKENMDNFPFVPMEVVERSLYDGGTYFLIQTVADRNGWEVAEVRPDIPYQLRTAKLLAAAPELLEALEMCTKAMASVLPDFNPYDQAAYEKARAAICKAKAKGQEHD